jgi:hypothetical protein
MQNKLLTPHFSQMEFTESPTAKKYSIDNTPTPENVANLRSLCTYTLEPLREKLNLPIVITSGFRCKALNDIVSHCCHRSQHLQGQAADFHVAEAKVSSGLSRRELLVKAFRLIIEDDAIDYDQLIIYPTFLHVSFVSHEANRHYIMVAQSNGRYGRVTREAALSII